MSTHKTFFGKIFGWIGDLFHSANQSFLQTAITVTQTVKDVLSSGVIDTLTALIPSTLDDAIVKVLRDNLPKILADELLLQGLNSGSTEITANIIAKQILDSFGGLPNTRKEEFYTSVAAKIYILLQQVQAGNKVTFGQAAMLVEAAYQSWLQSKQP